VYPALQVYSHLGAEPVGIEQDTRVLGVLAVKPVSSPEQSVALAGLEPVQTYGEQELKSNTQDPSLQK
jgi:hypothetical protein